MKLGALGELEIIHAIDDFRKRFKEHFRVKKLDWISTTLSDREKLRYYLNLNAHTKK